MPVDSGSLRKAPNPEAFLSENIVQEIKAEIVEKIIPTFPKNSEFKAIFRRLFEPWPEWTLIAIGKYTGAYFSTLNPKQITLGIKAFFRGEFENIDDLTFSKLIGHLAGISKYFETIQNGRESSADELHSLSASTWKIVLERLQYFLSLPKEESEKCIAAFAKAYSKTFDQLGHPRGAKLSRPILWALIFRWPIIEKMPSISALHEYLLTVLPPHLVGDKKRLEGICKEHKIKFRSRGRPKKS